MTTLRRLDGRGLLSDLEDLGGDALVVLGTDACGACRLAKRVLAELPVDALGGGDFFVADVDPQHAMGLVEEWEVHHLPCLVIVRDGDPWARVSARLVPGELAAAITAARAGPADPEL